MGNKLERMSSPEKRGEKTERREENGVREREEKSRAETMNQSEPFVCGDVNKIFDFVCLPHVRI